MTEIAYYETLKKVHCIDIVNDMSMGFRLAFFLANFIYFLYIVLGKRSVQNEPFSNPI